MKLSDSKSVYGFDTQPIQCVLLQKALADWPRRSAPMLMINCGDGKFLPFLWHAGFDIVATESDVKMRETASRRPVPALDIYAAEDTDLPFDNETFDWTIVRLLSGNPERLEKTSREALRVSRRGLMFTFWNSSSVPLLCWRLLHRNPWPAPAAAWHQVWLAARHLASGKIKSFAILPNLPGKWSAKKSFAWLNSQISLLPLGAWAIVRVDFYPARPLTPMPLRIDSNLAKMETGIEWAHKRASNPSRNIKK